MIASRRLRFLRWEATRELRTPGCWLVAYGRTRRAARRHLAALAPHLTQGDN